jgi:hypothetical protein
MAAAGELGVPIAIVRDHIREEAEATRRHETRLRSGRGNELRPNTLLFP